jgi:hypothetical protein
LQIRAIQLREPCRYQQDRHRGNRKGRSKALFASHS